MRFSVIQVVRAVTTASLLLCGCLSDAPDAPPASPASTPPPPVASPSPKGPLPGVAPRDPALTARLAEALAARGARYAPRTRHLRASGAPKFTNRLILEDSPYLLQHAHNPVDWHPWGEEAFAAARREGRPVLLSVGYSTCHWCHVMEHESFEDLEIAEFINRHFIAIKVDRERRPDVDSVYMSAVQMMAGRGGWPMTVVMTPSGEPFFGGTYFPARDGDRGSRKGFLTILRELREGYASDPDGVQARAKSLSQRMQAAARPAPPAEVPGPELIEVAAEQLLRRHDRRHGGFGRAPKFPQPALLKLLLQVHRRTREDALRDAVTLTLREMAEGGIYDQVGGGFHRYATDARWLVPHFEKMLYDNALLVDVYLDAYQLTGEARFARVARETLDYVLREMTSPAGLFYSATDADSLTPDGHAEEGWFFTWTPAELRATLSPEDAALIIDVHGVTEQGNFEGRNILSWPEPLAEVAPRLNTTPDALRDRVEAIHATLYATRARRPAPLKDTKALAAWNGLMIGALARGGLVLGEPRYVEAASRAADAALTRMVRGGRLRRVVMGERASHLGMLDDHAFLASGLLDLFEATGQARWLEAAVGLHEQLEALFRDPVHGGYFMTGSDGEALLVREKPTRDGAEPSGNAVAARNLRRLATLTGAEVWRERADAVLAAFASEMRRRPTGMAYMLTALDYALDRPKEVVLVTRGAGPGAEALLEAASRTYAPNRVLVRTSEEGRGALVKQVPLVEGKVALGGAATAYVCEQGVCRKPTTDPGALRRELMTVEPYGGR
ncbi:MAG: thioredoxin domain-containing protein [Myxococcales bacterium]|nr:thioredoxin domain-containing protein [Myxococcales bacterium]